MANKLRTNSSGRIVAVGGKAAVCGSSLPSFAPSQNTAGLAYGAMGDTHYVFGDDLETNGPTFASLNIDDNAGTNSLIWFYAKQGSTEYTISYTQQEFDFTVGGKSIDSITISETGESDILYTLGGVEGQTTFKGGVSFSGFDVFTLGPVDVKILARNIPDNSGCNNGDPFGLFHLDVHFNDALYNVDEVGGALYYLWKTVKDTTGVQNTTSEAGIDGLGIYLATGTTGFTSRTSFEVLVKEVKDLPIIEEIAIKFNELSGLNGAWVASWDPLVEDVPDCSVPMLSCPLVPANADPTMIITMTWTDLDVAKEFLGCDWTNGETKEVYTSAGGYSNYTFSGSAGGPNAGSCLRDEGEFWRKTHTTGGPTDAFSMNGFVDGFGGFHFVNKVLYGGVGELRHGTGAFSYEYSNLSSFGPAGPGVNYPFGWTGFLDGPFGGMTNWPYPTTGASGCLTRGYNGDIKDDQFTGFVTFTNGVTISWSKGNNWLQRPLPTACEAELAAMPASFDISFNADSLGDTFGSDGFDNFTATRDVNPKGGADISYSWDDEPFPDDACGGNSCYQIRFRLYGFCTGNADFTWTVTRPARACVYLGSIPVIPSLTSDPTGDYTFNVIDGNGGGGAGPCSVVVDNIATGQQGTVTIS